jgi:hypothetical protein
VPAPAAALVHSFGAPSTALVLTPLSSCVDIDWARDGCAEMQNQPVRGAIPLPFHEKGAAFR